MLGSSEMNDKNKKERRRRRSTRRRGVAPCPPWMWKTHTRRTFTLHDWSEMGPKIDPIPCLNSLSDNWKDEINDYLHRKDERGGSSCEEPSCLVYGGQWE